MYADDEMLSGGEGGAALLLAAAAASDEDLLPGERDAAVLALPRASKIKEI
ncbi:hypothetical protein [Burkholderia sp. MBR-1]|uniref:hypothetical protein n=1 Tax=Burkholderia sp. MBR-1 TaxID=2732364 RepID=UPI0015EE8D72|nr:hypothetical protein [Burkholderia sp. MBR-1]QMI49812.1 hypothetical protein MBR110_30550 [Burkholderia sp. MBR-1]